MKQCMTEHDDDMPAEIDFSKGTRGKFPKGCSTLKLPVLLVVNINALTLGIRQ